MQKERLEILKKYLVELADNPVSAREALIAWRDGKFKEMLEKADLADATVEDIKEIVKSGEVDTTVLEQVNGSCDDIDVPTSMGNCVA